MFTAALFMTAKIWKQPKCLLTDEWIKKLWDTHTDTDTHTQTHPHTYIHPMEYSASRKKEILPFATTWINFEGIILSEISQTEKDKYYMILLI